MLAPEGKATQARDFRFGLVAEESQRTRWGASSAAIIVSVDGTGLGKAPCAGAEAGKWYAHPGDQSADQGPRQSSGYKPPS